MKIKEKEGIVCVEKTFTSCNILSCEVGTNTPRGGDAGHGGVTLFRLKDEGGTAWDIEMKLRNGETLHFENPESITIKLLGDTEAETFLSALKFAVFVLKFQHKMVKSERR